MSDEPEEVDDGFEESPPSRRRQAVTLPRVSKPSFNQARDANGKFLPALQGASRSSPSNWVPNPQAPFQRSTANQVLIATMIAFMMAAAGDLNNHKLDNGTIGIGSFGRSLIERNLPAWGIVFVVLIIMSDIESTNQLAAAFAWLIALAVILNKGPDAFKNLQFIVNGQKVGDESTTDNTTTEDK